MGTFKIIKKGNGNFWHNFNNGSKEVNLSNWEIVLDSINQTVSLQMLNGANVPINSVDIADVVVIDETDISLEETFGSVSALRTRLIELNYTPYIVLNGFVPEAPIDGLIYGRKDAEWVEVSGGGGGNLQQVTDNGNTTTNAIEVSNYIKASEFRSSADDITFTDGSGSPIFFFASTGSNQANFDKALLTADRNFSLPDANGTIALTSNIPTVDATPTDGSSNTVSSNGVFDALANKVDANAPITGTVKTKITYDSKGLVTDGADALTSDIADSLNRRYVTDAQLTIIGNTSGTNTGDNATNSQYSGLATSKQDVLTDIVLGALINGYTSKTTPVGADGFLISNSADSNKAYTVSYTNLSATLKAYFDTIYANPGTIVKRILNSTVETSLLTGTTSETLIYSAPVIAGGSFTTDDYFNFQAVFRKQPGNSIGCTYRVYISNTNNFATASLLATWASPRFNTVFERRNLYFKADNTINSSIPATTSTQTDLTNSDAALTSISLNPANDIYFFVSAQLGVGTDNVKMTAIKIYN